jgi:hypothetical protein
MNSLSVPTAKGDEKVDNGNQGANKVLGNGKQNRESNHKGLDRVWQERQKEMGRQVEEFVEISRKKVKTNHGVDSVGKTILVCFPDRSRKNRCINVFG